MKNQKKLAISQQNIADFRLYRSSKSETSEPKGRKSTEIQPEFFELQNKKNPKSQYFRQRSNSETNHSLFFETKIQNNPKILTFSSTFKFCGEPIS